MSSLGDLWDDMWLEAGESGTSGDHGFAFMEFVFGLFKFIGIIIGVIILIGLAISALEYFGIPALDWVVNLITGQ